MENGQNRVAEQAKLHAIIPAGGAGTRLWPLSRVDRPKFLLDILGRGRTLLEATVLRLAPLSQSVTIVTGRAHANAVAAQTDALRAEGLVPETLDIHIVVEPSGRDSMPAIGLAMVLIEKRYGEGVIVGSFAADHAMEDEAAFQDVVREAILGAQSGFITTIGIEPSSPSTAFGYIQPTAKEVASNVFQVHQFVEKPPLEVARTYVNEGYLWNAGMFVMSCAVALGHLRELHASMWETLQELAQIWGDEGEGGRVGPGQAKSSQVEAAQIDARQVEAAQIDARQVEADRADAEHDWAAQAKSSQIEALWGRIPKIAIDHALAEPVAQSGGVAVVKAPDVVGWSDVGDMKALAQMVGVASASSQPGIAAASAPVLSSQPGIAAVSAPVSSSQPGIAAVSAPVSPSPVSPSSASSQKEVGENVGGDVVEVNASAGFVSVPKGKLVAVVGIDGAVVVDTGDVLLVTTTEHAQSVKDVVDALKDMGRTDLT